MLTEIVSLALGGGKIESSYCAWSMLAILRQIDVTWSAAHKRVRKVMQFYPCKITKNFKITILLQEDLFFRNSLGLEEYWPWTIFWTDGAKFYFKIHIIL